MTFAEQFCRRHGVPPDHFEAVVFWRCLHRRAWLLAPLIKLFSREYFEPDRELIRGVGHLKSPKEFWDPLADFESHPGNHGLWRRRLKIRVSAGRLCRLVAREFAHEPAPTAQSMEPFPSRAGAESDSSASVHAEVRR